MKTSVVFPVAGCLFLTSALFADIVVPGADGMDGALAITEDTVIDLGASGSYDPDEWAVVFRYTSVDIATGVTLSFTNHPRKAPVIWLVSGDVTIDGTVDLGGAVWARTPSLAEPGPGGFAGGMGYLNATTKASAGYGPGGGPSGAGDRGAGGSYGTTGIGYGSMTARDPYGNASLVPLIGGSGGGGQASDYPGGGAGGGAILIAATGTVSVEGSLLAIGGAGSTYAGGGSGGGIRIVADTIDGDGTVSAIGGAAPRAGGMGRIRFERVTNSMGNVTNQVMPPPSVIDLLPNDTALVFPPVDAPTAKIFSVGGQVIVDDPAASFGAEPADAKLDETALDAEGKTLVVIETENVSDNSEVTLLLQPRIDSAVSSVDPLTFPATRDATYVDPIKDRWTVDVPVAIGYAALQVRVDRQ